MSTFFGHGRLRLYLLKLLDESPRHGYEIISLLRDRFLGVYSPSPGTIYPRLARLEEEGLVTHTEEGGRKVYSLTDKGREELRARERDLDDLEREITDSVRDIARAVKQDVRETISSLREELKFAAGGARRPAEEPPKQEDTGREAPAEEAPRQEETAAGASGAEAGQESRERDREQAKADHSCDDGQRWSREWEKFTQGFGAFGAVWGRGGQGRTPDLDQALREFSERVRDVAREAGTVGGAALHDLRRILDDTVEVIRRDARTWGPPGKDSAEPETDRADGSGTPSAERPEPGAQEPEETPKAEEAPQAGKPAEPEEEPRAARPMPPADGGGDPWSQAVDDPGSGSGTDR
ncbi:helix-turn-helix transcriptional regulator [Nocardiopsis sp. CC223A]|uniref:helix-turn-helix transcriptional regulator n=1 Tax=Nocardiopsis sp. CC223A TaxID=3044051 RepID=UPI00278C495B|nr:helix-turn-helix transcriptional regulator [Nocardiopsis sp. CC223A]